MIQQSVCFYNSHSLMFDQGLQGYNPLSLFYFIKLLIDNGQHQDIILTQPATSVTRRTSVGPCCVAVVSRITQGTVHGAIPRTVTPCNTILLINYYN